MDEFTAVNCNPDELREIQNSIFSHKDNKELRQALQVARFNCAMCYRECLKGVFNDCYILTNYQQSKLFYQILCPKNPKAAVIYLVLQNCRVIRNKEFAGKKNLLIGTGIDKISSKRIPPWSVHNWMDNVNVRNWMKANGISRLDDILESETKCHEDR
jgi:hypothetical protein